MARTRSSDDATHDDQGHRDRDLQRRRQAMNAARPEPADAGIILQGRDDHRTTETGRRQQSEHQAGRQAKPDTDRDHGEIDSQRLLDFETEGADRPTRTTPGNVEEHDRAESASQTRQDDRFGQQMLHQPSPARADRLADGQFPLTHRAANLHHAGDIQAHDQQHRSGQGERDGLDDSGIASVRDCRSGRYGSTMPALNSFVAGYCLASRDVTAETAALACAMPTPGDRRPWMCSHSLPRSERTLLSRSCRGAADTVRAEERAVFPEEPR